LIFSAERRDETVKRAFLLLLTVLPLAGCTQAPAVDVVGSFFPAWLLCLIVAIILTVLARLALLRLRISVAYPILFYLSLAALFTFALWLIFFR
jgi:hypothetical protein